MFIKIIEFKGEVVKITQGDDDDKKPEMERLDYSNFPSYLKNEENKDNSVKVFAGPKVNNERTLIAHD
jgi:hypothetical protein